MEEIKIENLENISFLKLDKPKYNSRSELEILYWLFHPRFRFFKTVPLDSKLLDIGASTGGLFFWKKWEFPNRNDIKMYAIDRKKGEFFEKFDDFQILDLNEEKIKYDDNFFDAIFMSHIVEHLNDIQKIMNECWRLLKKGGRIYIETPTVETIEYPSKSVFLSKGIKTSTINFFDDRTHSKAYSNEELRNFLQSSNFKVVESGIINNRFLEDELLTYGLNNDDETMTTYSIWSKLSWAHYVIGEKF